MARGRISGMIGALTGLILASTARSQTTPQPAAGAYRLDTHATRILFGVRLLGLTTQYGTFTGVTGALDLDPDHPSASHLEVHAPTATVVAPARGLDSTIRGRKWLDVATYPEMVFHGVNIAPTGPGAADVTGNLTLHGVTRPLVLHARIKTVGPNDIRLEARGRLNRLDYGVSTRARLLGDEVEVILEAVFERAAAGRD